MNKLMVWEHLVLPYLTPYVNSVENRQAIQRWFVEETRLGIPVDFTNEGIRGLCHDRATMFPAQCGQGATWNKELISEIARVTAEEAKALGYTNIYSPILDIAQDPRWGRVVECYGEDPFLVGELGKRMIKGLQAEGLVATLNILQYIVSLWVGVMLVLVQIHT